MKTTDANPLAGLGSVTVFGAGNIGSQLLPLTGRIPAIGHVIIVDHDTYEEKNLISQSITPADVGQPKAIVQARRLREINPRLRVTPIVERLENAPLGALRADVLLGCLDSRFSRRIASSMAWRLGVPYIDAGVQADGMLARIHVYRPDPANACLECAWDHQDYLAEQDVIACDGSKIASAPTNAPASLGALAAAMQALELEKIFADAWEHVPVGREILIDAKSHRHFVTRLPRNPACRFDHRTFEVREFHGAPGALTLADLFALGTGALRVEGQRFVRQWACMACQTMREVFGLRDRIAAAVQCPGCGNRMRAIGFHTFDSLSAADVPNGLLRAPISSHGIHGGDIFSVTSGTEEAHYEIIDPTIREL